MSAERSDDGMADLRRSYGAQLPSRVREIEDSFARCERDGARSLETAHYLAHRLAGSAPMYGFADVGRAARAVVEQFRSLPDGEEPPSPAWWREVSLSLDALRACVERDASSTARAALRETA